MKIRLLIISLIFCSIIFMSIGYSALNANLSISGEASVIPVTYLEITNISVATLEGGATETFNSSFLINQTNIHVSMPNQDSKVIYEIEVTNDTNNNYYLENINEIINSNPSISYEITDSESLFFAPNSVNVIELVIYYENSATSDVDLSLNLRYDFIVVPFEKLDYIVSTGTQYIDTGVMNTGNYIFESEFLPSFTAKKEGFWLFSGRKVTSHTLGLYFFVSSTFNYTINSYGGSTNANSALRLPKNTWYDLYYSINKFTINSIDIEVFSQAIVPEEQGASILLGGNLVNWDGSVDTRQFEGSIKYFKITDAITGELIRNFIPVKVDSTNEVCYWDTVTKSYFSNIGTGEFLDN